MPRRFTIGRDRQCDVPLENDSISRRHAEIWLAEDGTLRIADLHSSNGTRVLRNGTRLSAGEAVLPGDQLRLGSVTIDVDELVERIENVHQGALHVPRVARIRCSCGVLKSPGEACLGCGGSHG